MLVIVIEALSRNFSSPASDLDFLSEIMIAKCIMLHSVLCKHFYRISFVVKKTVQFILYNVTRFQSMLKLCFENMTTHVAKKVRPFHRTRLKSKQNINGRVTKY